MYVVNTYGVLVAALPGYRIVWLPNIDEQSFQHHRLPVKPSSTQAVSRRAPGPTMAKEAGPVCAGSVPGDNKLLDSLAANLQISSSTIPSLLARNTHPTRRIARVWLDTDCLQHG